MSRPNLATGRRRPSSEAPQSAQNWSRERQQAAVAELGRLALAGMALGELQQQAARLLVETLDTEFSAPWSCCPMARTCGLWQT